MTWEPATDFHAIERVTLAVQFQEQLNSIAWKRVVDRANATFPRGEYFGHAQTRPTVISFGGPAMIPAVPPISPDEVNAYLFRRIVDERPVDEISVRRDGLSFGTTVYTRWTEFFSACSDVLMPFIEMFVGNVAIAFVQLEYWDRFIHAGDGAITYQDVLDVESPHVPKAVFAHDGTWHAHTGFFLPKPDDTVLINLNIDVLDVQVRPEEIRRSVGVYSMARRHDLHEMSSDVFAETSQSLHDVLKPEFGRLLTPAMRLKLGL